VSLGDIQGWQGTARTPLDLKKKDEGLKNVKIAGIYFQLSFVLTNGCEPGSFRTGKEAWQ
jgi:hypothetical protein